MQIRSEWCGALAVGIRFADRSVVATAMALRPNIAVLKMDAHPPYGTRVTVVLPSNVEIEGIVRWSSGEAVGIQFDRPRARALRALHHLISH